MSVNRGTAGILPAVPEESLHILPPRSNSLKHSSLVPIEQNAKYQIYFLTFNTYGFLFTHEYLLHTPVLFDQLCLQGEGNRGLLG